MIVAFDAPPSLDDIAAIAHRALTDIPEPLRRFAADVVVRVEEFVDEETERDMGLESPFDLLGLYRGVSLGHKSAVAVRSNVDMIFLYRQPILAYWCESGESLTGIVRHVLIHEIGHHFGFSDEDMDRIEDQG